jgi:hypothetical protein
VTAPHEHIEDSINHQTDEDGRQQGAAERPAQGLLSKTAHRSIDSCQHNHCVECSHQKPQLRNPHACLLHNSSIETAAVKTSKEARRREPSSGSIAEPAGICGPNQHKRRKRPLARAWWPIVLLVPALAIVQQFVILREERCLRRRFGADYEAYTQRVRRWL